MNRHIFIVFGLSGVGKTTACQAFVSRHSGYLYVRASELLRNATTLSSEELRTECEQNILHNQEILVTGLSAIMSKNKQETILLDAHNVIDNDRQIVFVPIQVIRAMAPSGLIFLEADASSLISRRNATDRPRPFRSSSELERQQSLSRQRAIQFAHDLHIPIVIGKVSEDFILDPIIEELNEKLLKSAE